MTKTTFSSGVIVTSQWLNGAQQIFFDGQNLDWHYPPLGLESFITGGPSGLDSRYITLATDQPNLLTQIFGSGQVTYKYASGSPVTGTKVVTGLWTFGYDPLVTLSNPANDPRNAPLNFTTNTKYNYADGLPAPTIAQKYNSLSDPDIITKQILSDQISDTIQNLEIDNGYYYISTGDCNNYSIPSTNTSNQICTP
jgi:hypothetical protein